MVDYNQLEYYWMHNNNNKNENVVGTWDEARDCTWREVLETAIYTTTFNFFSKRDNTFLGYLRTATRQLSKIEQTYTLWTTKL